ncbi:amidase [Irpex lacteus]|nr:amidase [Irpex lacteus]
MTEPQASWKTIASRKLADSHAALAAFPEWHLKQTVSDAVLDVTGITWSELTRRELEIVNHDATALAQAIRERQYTAVEVTKAFCHVASIAHQLTNCLTEIFFAEGLQRAAELDKYQEETGDVVGPLHGVPVSIKDHIMVKGHDTSTGYIAWAYKTYATKDAVAVDLLRRAGAVLYVKTANPQTLLALETNNNIYGRTLNPLNRSLTPGGSSGGESALIALHGSPLGLGTDIGGSIRIPAAYLGLYGLKGSIGRMPHAGLMGSHDGLDAIIGALGPIATSARDLALFCRVMLQYEPWLSEPPLLEIPWKQDVADGLQTPAKLCFAILWDDGVVLPHPPILDALKRTKDALLRAGHEVVDWRPVDHQYAWDLICKLYFLDGGEEYREILANDPPVPQTRWIMEQVPNQGQPFSIAETFKLNREREIFREKITNYWNESQRLTKTGRPVDAILSPVAATLAPPHDTTRWWGYTSYWNLMDFSAAVFPVGRFKAESYRQLDLSEDFIAPNEPRNTVEEYVRAQWNPPTYDNAAVSLQLIGRRLNEEKVLGMLRRVEDALGGR